MLTLCRRTCTKAEFERLTHHVINILCKPVTSQSDIDCYVIKFQLNDITLIPYIAELYPDASFLFMYRDGLPVAQSLVKLSKVWLCVFVIFHIFFNIFHTHITYPSCFQIIQYNTGQKIDATNAF